MTDEGMKKYLVPLGRDKTHETALILGVTEESLCGCVRQFAFNLDTKKYDELQFKPCKLHDLLVE